MDSNEKFKGVFDELEEKGWVAITWEKHDSAQSGVVNSVQSYAGRFPEKYGIFAAYDNGQNGVLFLVKRTKENINGVLKPINDF